MIALVHTWKSGHVRRQEVDRPYTTLAAGRMDGSGVISTDFTLDSPVPLSRTRLGWALFRRRTRLSVGGFNFHCPPRALGCRLVFLFKQETYTQLLLSTQEYKRVPCH